MTIYVASGVNNPLSGSEYQTWQDQAALLDPRAYNVYEGTSVNKTVPVGGRWYALDQWFTDTVSGGPSWQRYHDARFNPMVLPAGFNLTTDASQIGDWYVCQPELVNALRIDTGCSTNSTSTATDASITVNDIGKPVSGTNIPAGSYVGLVTAGASFVLVDSGWNAVNASGTGSGISLTIGDSRYQSDPKALYYSRLATLPTLTLNKLALSVAAGTARGTTTTTNFDTSSGKLLLALVTQHWTHDAAWTGLYNANNGGWVMNLATETSDDHQERVAFSLYLPFRVKNTPADLGAFQGIEIRAGSVSGNTTDTSLQGYGGIRYVQLPPTW